MTKGSDVSGGPHADLAETLGAAKGSRLPLAWLFDPLDRFGRRNEHSRDRWVQSELEEIPAGQRILDAGAGRLKYKQFCGHLVYVSQDLGAYDGVGDGLGCQHGKWDSSAVDIRSDIMSIPEEDHSFDVVLCAEVLEHVPDPVGALRELARLLRSGGVLLLTAPFCSLTHQSPFYFYTGFSQEFYRYWLTQLGFEIEETAFNGDYFEYLAQEMYRLPEIAYRYTGIPVGRVARQATRIVIRMLAALARTGARSSELLSFGLHVRARLLP